MASSYYRRRLHGGDGGDRPHGQKVVERRLKVAPTGILLRHHCTHPKVTVRITKVSLWKWKRCANFSLKMHHKAFSGRTRCRGSLQHSRGTLARFKGWQTDGMEEGQAKGEADRRGGTEDEEVTGKRERRTWAEGGKARGGGQEGENKGKGNLTPTFISKSRRLYASCKKAKLTQGYARQRRHIANWK